MSTEMTAKNEPLLRTLAPALRQLESSLRAWIGEKHRFPLSLLTRASLEGLATDLTRQASALDVDRPLLVIMLMGGTGVGKSTLLNALAGGAIAQASFVRPTTRDPVVYYHESIKPDRLDPALRHCRLAAHDRAVLDQKILVDTPDIDSNDLANREKLLALLPVADIVLYVGSQEKYHDQLGWELFLQQRKRRAFAFVLNKWDRCLHGDGGTRPDQDLLHDLEAQGFQNPMLFRTCAQIWLERNTGTGQNGTLPEGEQFSDLVKWLEMGLTRLEIEAIKARGVSQLLRQLEQVLGTICPPDLTEVSEKTRKAWVAILAEEAPPTVEVLLNTLDPYQSEIEQHFALEGQRRFRGIMAGYLHLITRVKYAGSILRDRLPFLPKSSQKVETTAAWDLAAFTRSCLRVAGDRHLDARGKALPNRLLVEADHAGFPIDLLSEPAEAAAKLNWRQRYGQALSEVLQLVERQWTEPTGIRRFVQGTIIWVADWVPPIALLGSLIILLWRFFDPMGKGYQFELSHVLVPPAILLIVLVIMHILIVLLLPLRWPAIRGEFRRRLEQRIKEELNGAYSGIPAEVAGALQVERKQVEKLLSETHEVAAWLEKSEHAAGIAGLYGN